MTAERIDAELLKRLRAKGGTSAYRLSGISSDVLESGGGKTYMRLDSHVYYGDTHMSGPYAGLVEAVDIVTYPDGRINERACRSGFLSEAAVAELVRLGHLAAD